MPAKRPREEAAQTPRKAEFAVEKEKVAAPKTKPPELKTPAEMLGPNGHRVDASAANWDGEGFFRVKMKGKPTSKQVVREWKDYHSIPQKARDEFAFGLSNDGVPLVFHRLRTIDGALRFNWSPVGEHGGGGMGLSASHRGKGIGREFVRWMMEHGHWTGTALGYSPAGKATVLSAHRAIVAQAMAENRPVSAAAVDAYKLAVPKGYLREGEAYRFVRVKGLDAGPKPANDVTAPVRRVKLRVA
jgi:GNAT superfamily N-acetyltransferase